MTTAPADAPATHARPAGGPVALEIAVTAPAGALVARDAGADRVELCTGLELGGLTPSQALVETVHETGIPAHALVRCRPGGFVHEPDEVALMEREVRTVLRSGAAGVVVGALRPDRTLDEDTLRRFVDAARSVSAAAEVTLHRAVDHAVDPVAAAAALAALGFTRVLTSGGAASARAGSATIARMVEAAGPVQVMAGAGVTPGDVPVLVAAGVAAVHLSAKRSSGGGHDGVPMGTGDDGSAHFVTDAGVVAAARAALDSLV
ncbi:copper homeostasis protein CutC [Curtobacterium sp. UCD-KPL2560]|uniref:copper homeostasis protein CutC n=1 Tax=Curtobacterium sp. UCD-KPL2560 TaxID=1885315 RepID=UPI000A994062|nr:copper homeostasis protein CutC [Curtobacterium sp. UCD-KPL2560]